MPGHNPGRNQRALRAAFSGDAGVGDARWQGASGAVHVATSLKVADFVLNDGFIYVLVAAGMPVWVGTAHNLITDSASRAQFRNALGRATSAFELSLPTDEHRAMELIADLETGRPLLRLTAA